MQDILNGVRVLRRNPRPRLGRAVRRAMTLLERKAHGQAPLHAAAQPHPSTRHPTALAGAPTLRTPSRWHRIRDVGLSTDRRRRTLVAMALLALVLMTSSAGVMLMVATASSAVNAVAVQWWAAISVGGMVVMTAFIRSGETARLSDPSLTVPQMVWTITSGAVAYVLAGDARGVVPAVLAMILFFGTFGLTVAEVIGIGVYALLAFGCAVAATTRFNASPFGYLDTAYALMVLIVLGGSIALNLRIQRIRARLQEQREALAQALAVNRDLATRDELTALPNRRAMQDLMERVRQAVAAMEIPHAAGVLRMTVSAGLALHLPGDMVEQTLERADQALYTAKSLGRNRVVVAPSGPRAARASAASS